MSARRPAVNRPDVVVVGCGGTGAVVAKELAEAGAGVVALEAGPWHDPSRDFSGLEWDMLNPIDSVFRWGPLDRTLPPWPRRTEGIPALIQTAGVGGNTLHYGANCPRGYVSAISRDWPIAYDDLVPYYFRVEDTLPVSVPDITARKDELFIKGCEASGIGHITGPDVTTSGWRMQPNAILPIARRPDPDPFRAGAVVADAARHPQTDGCTQCGQCIVGCRHPSGAPLSRIAKRGTAVSYAPMAIATGRCEIREGCFTVRILTERRGDTLVARGVRYLDAQGRVHEQDARVVVLAGGAIETPRLWLSSELPDTGAVGRYLTTHWFDYVSGELDEAVEMWRGQTSMVRAEFPGYGFIESQGLGPLAFGLLSFLGRRGGAGEDDGPWATRGRMFGAGLKRRMEAYARTLTIVICVDDDPEPGNGVSLAPGLADEHNPAPFIRYHASEATVRKRDWLARRAGEVLLAAGARPDSIHRADAQPSTIHMHGTMRMGRHPSESVVDPGCEAHLVKRLFVADTSVFPNGIGGPNPTLTAQAVATRTAAVIMRRYLS